LPPFGQLSGCPRIVQRRASAPYAFALLAYGLVSEAWWLRCGGIPAATEL